MDFAGLIARGDKPVGFCCSTIIYVLWAHRDHSMGVNKKIGWLFSMILMTMTFMR